MNPLLTVITLLASLRTDLYSKFNAALKNVGPVEQVEGSQAVISVIREVDWAKERIERVGVDLQATLDGAGKMLASFQPKAGEDSVMAASRFLEEYEKQIAAEALTAAITAKTVVLHADHETAITAATEKAEKKGRGEAEVEFNAKLEKTELVATRRAEAVTRLGALAAATLTDEQLVAEDAEATLTAIEGNISKLTEKNITEADRPKIYADLIACAHQPEVFEARLDVILDAVGPEGFAATGQKIPATPPKQSEKGKEALSASSEKKKVVI